MQAEKVLDGDTLVLVDGRHVRLIGVNTPEVAHPPRSEEPLAVDAQHQLEQLVRKSPLYLEVGQQPRDHYGRTLGHLYAADGRNVIAELLRQGLGFQVAIPPNLAHAECYAEAQTQARSSGSGVWRHAYFQPQPSDGAGLKGGYQRLQGKVSKVTLTQKVIWVDLVGNVSLKLDRRNATYLEGDTLDRIVAQSRARPGSGDLRLEVRGWLIDRNRWGGQMRRQIESGQRKRFLVNVSHHSQWEILPDKTPSH
ncbi:MAG TPA: thermonuclease family protein [Dongiaceae bacterium]|nr:thermonuclease family protein [Dongiaceae bacterium]